MHRRNVIIVSARRSGTHLLNDLIVNNFGYESTNANYLDYSKFTHPKLNGLEKLMDQGNKVTWTHAHDYRDYKKYNHKPEQEQKIDNYFKESKIIFIYRDSRDVIDSCYHRPEINKKYSSFSDFYENFDFDGYELIDQKYSNFWELLQQHYRNWFSVYFAKELLELDMEIISYEDIISSYNNSVEKIGSFLECPVQEVIDVRLSSLNDKKEGVVYTYNDFRSGKVGTWKNTLSKKLGDKIGVEYTLEIENGLNCYTNDIKIHKYHTPEREKFHLNYKDWNITEEKLNNKLEKYRNKFDDFNIDIESFLENRYEECDHRGTDLRYKHKVFYYDDYVLKFIYPCKATLDKKTFEKVIPVASKELLLTILETDEFLYFNEIVPKLLHAGIYKGLLYLIQERCPSEEVLVTKYQIWPSWNDWSWPANIDYVYEGIMRHFFKALENNIVLTDIVNVYNCALDKNKKFKYFDLDGIKYFKSKNEMENSLEYKNALGIIKEVQQHGNIYNKLNF